jgi:hypothetical protein
MSPKAGSFPEAAVRPAAPEKTQDVPRSSFLLLCIFALTTWVSCDLLPTPAEPPPFEPLFDGKSLAGWEGNSRFFRVEGGSLIAGRLDSPIPHNEFLASKESFGDFDLRFEARLLGTGRNAGVQFRSERVAGSHEMIGYQCDIGEWSAGLIWGLLYDESRRARMLDEPEQVPLLKAVKQDGWNRLRVLAIGPRVRIWVNGFPTVDYTETDPAVEPAGRIGLQIHGGPPTECHYRNIKIRRLSCLPHGLSNLDN